MNININHLIFLDWLEFYRHLREINTFAFLPFLIAIYVGISFFSSWRRLSDRYRNKQNILVTASSQTAKFVGKFCVAFYRDFVNIGVSKQGLYLSLEFPFLLFHPPLFIPWHAVTYARVNSSDRYELHIELHIENPTIAVLLLPKEAFQSVEDILANIPPPPT